MKCAILASAFTLLFCLAVGEGIYITMLETGHVIKSCAYGDAIDMLKGK